LNESVRPFLDKVLPDAWRAAQALSTTVVQEVVRTGVTEREIEIIKVRSSQLNACAFCLDLHAREARRVGVPQQKLDMLAAWRDSSIYDERERAMLAIAEAATVLPLTEDARADLAGARNLLGDTQFAAAEWVAVTINAFNRISILSEHPVRPRKD
jgi:AhpD family alkylhydroperoxidase